MHAISVCDMHYLLHKQATWFRGNLWTALASVLLRRQCQQHIAVHPPECMTAEPIKCMLRRIATTSQSMSLK
jgi:hypothetical protein